MIETRSKQRRQKVKKINKLNRQGDVMLEFIGEGEIPMDATPMETEPHRVVLAYGEVTGHAHALPTTHASMYAWKGDRLVVVKEDTMLVHEEHYHHPIPKGNYIAVEQVAYTPAEIRNVAD